MPENITQNITQLIPLSLPKIITISLSSAVFATLLGKISDFLIEKWKDNKNRQSKLYKPVKFYLMLLENVDQNRKSLFEEMKKGTREINFENSDAQNNWQNETNRQLSVMGKPVVDEMLKHIENVKKLFESNPELIKDKHWKAIKKFFDGYLKRKMLIAGG